MLCDKVELSPEEFEAKMQQERQMQIQVISSTRFVLCVFVIIIIIITNITNIIIMPLSQ